MPASFGGASGKARHHVPTPAPSASTTAAISCPGTELEGAGH